MFVRASALPWPVEHARFTSPSVKRRTKILLLLLPALVLAVLLLLPHGDYRREVEAYKKQLLAQGEKLSVAELAPLSSTNGPNAAIALTNAMEGFRLPVDYPPTMKLVGPGIAIIGHSNPQPIEMASYASNMVKAAELRAILQAPVLHYNLDYTKGFGVLLPHLAKLKNADSLLAITATQALHEQNYSEAWPDLLAAVDLPRLFKHDLVVISDLVRVAMVRIAIAATWETLHSGHQWSDAQLAELQAKWMEIDLFTHPDSVMAMERFNGMVELADLRRTNDGQYASLLTSISNPSGTAQTSDGLLGQLSDKLKEWYNRYPRYWMWRSSGSYDEELYYLQITTTAEAAARRMMGTNGFVPIYNELLGQETNLIQLHPRHEKNFVLISPGYYEIYTKYLLRLAGNETGRRLTVTAIALERFHLQRNAYPASLNELVPAFLPQIPTDFMDGKPMRYRLQPDGHFLLYSVGEDGKDDGGDGTSDGFATDWVRPRDIVWPRAATPQEVADYLKLHPPETNSPAR
jgi:hypothetical protein